MRRARRLPAAATLVTALLLGWLADGVEAQAPPSVNGYTLESSRRVTRTHWDFTYRAQLTNPLPSPLAGATATLTSTAPATQVIDGALSFGGLGAGATVASQDTFTIRQDRALPFNPAALRWAVGVQLGGAPGQAAWQATIDLPPAGVAAGEIEVLPTGGRVARTIVEIAFVPGATVADVNGVLATIGGRIVSMLEGVAVVVVRIPDPGSLAALDAIVAQLVADPLVRTVIRGGIPETQVLPQSIATTGEGAFSAVRHHLAVRGHAAWNARGAILALAERPQLVVADKFGSSAPNADFATVDVLGDFPGGGLDEHGYHVLGIIAGAFEGPVSDRGWVTGLFPETLLLRAVDVVQPGGFLTNPEADNAVIQRVKAAPAGVGVVVSRSMSDCDVMSFCADASAAVGPTVVWIEKVRGTGGLFGLGGGPDLEERFIYLVAAANEKPWAPGVLDAETASTWAAARLLAGLETPGLFGPQAVPNLTNTLVVENVVPTATPPFQPGCLNSSSKRPGDLAGIGTDVWSFTGPVTGASFLTGTSMATPQVAGLAAFVWALDPSLTPQGVLDILVSTSRQQAGDFSHPECDTTTLPAHQIDAYAAVLAVDDAAAAPVRRAILDVADGTGAAGSDGMFTEHDVALFLAELDGAAGAVDYSRYDLNGDGRTGGTTTERFDLNLDGFYNALTLSIEGSVVPFTEGALTDVQILCYYAYSPLYQGDPAQRSLLLGAARCFEAQLTATLGAFAAGSATLTAQVTDPDGVPLAGVLVEFVATGGTVNPGVGTTDENGVVEAIATLDDGVLSMMVEVTARSGPGGDIIDQQIVQGQGQPGDALVASVVVPSRVDAGSGPSPARCNLSHLLPAEQGLPASLAVSCPAATITAQVSQPQGDTLAVDVEAVATGTLDQCEDEGGFLTPCAVSSFVSADVRLQVAVPAPGSVDLALPVAGVGVSGADSVRVTAIARPLSGGTGVALELDWRSGFVPSSAMATLYVAQAGTYEISLRIDAVTRSLVSALTLSGRRLTVTYTPAGP